ncbi:MAG: DUF6062 family protein [Oscillospiraceae bacterium]|nr:DUF6062 family protein [Oscillospiraceae bacterium]
MKETIYTIPINEAFDTAGGACPVCVLARGLDRDALDYVMGAAMMEPDVRIETNRLGFCASHMDSMLQMGNRLSLALMLESYLLEQRATLASAKNDPASTCFICSRRDGYMAAYYRNMLYIWETDQAFREKFAAARLCWPHIGALMHGAAAGLGRKALPVFRAALLDMAYERFAALTPPVSTFCQSFDHRNADKPLGDAKYAVERAVEWLKGPR